MSGSPSFVDGSIQIICIPATTIAYRTTDVNGKSGGRQCLSSFFGDSRIVSPEMGSKEGETGGMLPGRIAKKKPGKKSPVYRSYLISRLCFNLTFHHEIRRSKPGTFEQQIEVCPLEH